MRDGRRRQPSSPPAVAAAALMVLLVGLLRTTRVDGFSYGGPATVKGSVQRCGNEGEPVELPFTAEPCISCTCRDGVVQCERERCAGRDFCPVVTRNDSSACCSPCKNCSYAGQTYGNDHRWTSQQDACRSLTCKGGIVTISRKQCVTPCREPRRQTGYCCPLCPLKATRRLELVEPCAQCECARGWCQCHRTACPVLDCASAERRRVPGRCCAECVDARLDRLPPHGHCYFKGRFYQHEQSFRPDQCTLCKCQDAAVICKRFVCPPIDCPQQRVYYRPRLCCPFCRDRDPLSCVYVNETFAHGETWQLDLCTTCKCSNGEVKCATQQCEHPHGCPRGYARRAVPGQCCHVCEEKDATCTVFGDPHYKTFDGRAYSFQGTCRYILAQECVSLSGQGKPRFTVIAHNEQRDGRKFAWTRHLTVNFWHAGTSLRVSLLKGRRVKDNGTRVVLADRRPHIRLGFYSLHLDRQNNVILRARPLGLRVLWDGHSYAEVTVLAQYKGRLCGLCGDYNHDPSDELVTPDGHVARSTYEFGQSWRTGGWRKCSAARDRSYHRRLRERTRAHRLDSGQLAEIGFRALNGDDDGDDAPVNRSSRIIVGDALLSKSRYDVSSASLNERGEKKSRRRRRGRLLKLCENSREKWKRRRRSIKQCRLLKSSVFAPCHAVVDVRRYFRWCIGDVCACAANGRCFCESLLAYSRQCEAQRVLIDWRPHSHCQIADDCAVKGAAFFSCAPPCPPTCDGVAADCLQHACRPGCACPSQLLLHGNECIERSQCPTPSS